jgi:hypothetical protein
MLLCTTPLKSRPEHLGIMGAFRERKDVALFCALKTL